MGTPVGIRYLTAQDAGASFNGPWCKLGDDRRLTLTLTHTSTAAGTWALYYRDFETQAGIEVPDSAAEFANNPSGANAGTYNANFADMPGREWQLRYTRSGGAGSITVTAVTGDLLA